MTSQTYDSEYVYVRAYQRKMSNWEEEQRRMWSGNKVEHALRTRARVGWKWKAKFVVNFNATDRAWKTASILTLDSLVSIESPFIWFMSIFSFFDRFLSSEIIYVPLKLSNIHKNFIFEAFSKLNYSIELFFF